MLNGRKTILLVEIAGGFLSGTDHQTAANFAGGRQYRPALSETVTEFEILHLLARNPGRVFSKEQIYDIVWKESYSGDYNIVMSHIRNIREKIEDNPSKPIYIQTVWGVGYKFDNKLK